MAVVVLNDTNIREREQNLEKYEALREQLVRSEDNTNPMVIGALDVLTP